MESRPQTFDSGKGLLDAITAGDLALKDMCIGMVKASEKEGHVAFAPRSCNEWVDVPAELIGEVEVLRHVPCRDHIHPLVQFRLKIDDSNPVHAMVRKLLSPAASPTPTEMQSPVGAIPTGTSPWSAALSYSGIQQGQQLGHVHAQPRGAGGTGFEGAGFAPGRQFGQQLGQPVGTTQFASLQGRNRIAFAAPIGPGGIGGSRVGFIEGYVAIKC